MKKEKVRDFGCEHEIPAAILRTLVGETGMFKRVFL